MSAIIRPDGYSSLVKYVADHSHQTPEVAQQFRDSCASILDYVEDTLRNRPETDRGTAYDAIKEMAQAFQQVPISSQAAVEENKQNWRQVEKQLDAGQEATLSDKVVAKLEGEHTEATPGPEMPAMECDRRPINNASNWKKGTLVRTTVKFGAERASVEPDGDHYLDQRRFATVVTQVKDASPLLRALLLDRAVDPASVGQSESHFSMDASSTASAKGGVFKKRASAQSSMSAQGDSYSQWGPALADGLANIDKLKELVAGIRSIPATTVSVDASRSVTGSTTIEYTKGVVRKHRLTVELPLWFSRKDYYSDEKKEAKQHRKLGSLEELPAYLNV